jgi:GAF domain-containing protein
MAKIKPASRYVGSVTAARTLGVSRSTIHKAVKTGALVPDLRTPRGHVRFTSETLEMFREELTAETLREVSREQAPHAPARRVASGAVQQARLLAAIPQSLTSTSEAPEVCRKALDVIGQLVPHVDMSHVALAMPSDENPLAARVVAHNGYTAEAAATYRELGRAAGPFTTDEAIRTGRLVRIEMPGPPDQKVPSGTMVFFRQLEVRTLLALPLLSGGTCLGALVVLSHRERAWSATEIELLQAVAEHVAATVAAAKLLSKRRRMLSGGRDLVLTALSLKGAAPLTTAVERLAETYRGASDAAGVCLLGLGQDLLVGDERLREHAARARQDGMPRLDLVGAEDSMQTVVASALDLPGGGRVGLAAIWPGRRTDLEAQHKLLTIFGGACLLVL